MGQPEKDPKDNDTEKKTKPELGAILPDEQAPSPTEIMDDIESYQRKMEDEWESTKTSYQKKINQLMEEFLKQNLSEKMAAADELVSKEKEEPKRRTGTNVNPDLNMERLMSRVEKALRETERRTKDQTFEWKKEAPLTLSWDGTERRSFKKKLMITGGLTLFAAGLFWLGTFLFASAAHNLPYGHATALVMTADKVYTVDWFRKALYIHSLKQNYPLMSIESLPNSFLTGLAVTNKNLWTLDSFGRKIQLHALSIDHQIVSAFPSPGPKPAGAFYDGQNVWTGDADARMIYQHHANDPEEIIDQFSFEGGVLTAFEIINNRVWMLDGSSRVIRVYRLEKPLKLLGSFDLDGVLRKGTPSGLHVQGKTIYLLTDNPARLIKTSRRRLETVDPDDF